MLRGKRSERIRNQFGSSTALLDRHSFTDVVVQYGGDQKSPLTLVGRWLSLFASEELKDMYRCA
jgi:hypothetical protein